MKKRLIHRRISHRGEHLEGGTLRAIQLVMSTMREELEEYLKELNLDDRKRYRIEISIEEATEWDETLDGPSRQ